MKFTRADSPDQRKLTITYETVGSGYVIGERRILQSLIDFLQAADFAISDIGPTTDLPNALYRCGFVALQLDLRKAVERWHPTVSEAVAVEYKLLRG
jgi:hypothetical protein